MDYISLTREVIGGIYLTCEIKSESQYQKLGRSLIHKRICESYLSHVGNDVWNLSRMWNQICIPKLKERVDLYFSHTGSDWWNLSRMWNQIWIPKLKERVNHISLTREMIARQVIGGIFLAYEIKSEYQNKKSVWIYVSLTREVIGIIYLALWNQIWISKRKARTIFNLNSFYCTKEVIGKFYLACETKSKSPHKKIMWNLFLARGKGMVGPISYVKPKLNLKTKIVRNRFLSREKGLGRFCLVRDTKSEYYSEKLGRLSI